VDESDWAQLYEDHYAGLVARLTMVLRDASEAEDVAQEAWLRAYRARASFDGRNPRGWLHTIGVRLALNELRRRRRAVARLGSPTVTDDPTKDQDLWIALGRLNARQRAALLLHYADGYTLEETAKILGVPAGTVSSWVSRARQRLRTDLRRETSYDDGY
jgi:RNA polymerase sigma-70 factor (ECF subfamily)